MKLFEIDKYTRGPVEKREFDFGSYQRKVFVRAGSLYNVAKTSSNKEIYGAIVLAVRDTVNDPRHGGMAQRKILDDVRDFPMIWVKEFRRYMY